MMACCNCVFWTRNIHPVSRGGLRGGECRCPQVVGPQAEAIPDDGDIHSDIAYVADASDYYAVLLPMQDFCCSHHSRGEAK
jgi:hypothetical protein